jgi:hypothetical protein
MRMISQVSLAASLLISVVASLTFASFLELAAAALVLHGGFVVIIYYYDVDNGGTVVTDNIVEALSCLGGSIFSDFCHVPRQHDPARLFASKVHIIALSTGLETHEQISTQDSLEEDVEDFAFRYF